MERAQGCLLENHGISRATALAADADALVSRDAVVISPSFRAAVGHEAGPSSLCKTGQQEALPDRWSLAGPVLQALAAKRPPMSQSSV